MITKNNNSKLNIKIFLFIFSIFLLPLISAEAPNLINGNSDRPSLDSADISNKTFNVNITQNITQEITNNIININQFDQSLNTTDSVQFDNLTLTGNLTLGQKITFAFGEMIDNLVDGWIRATGSLNVTDQLNVMNESTFGDTVNIVAGVPTLIFDDEHMGHDKYRIRVEDDNLVIGAGSPIIDFITIMANGMNEILVDNADVNITQDLTVGGNLTVLDTIFLDSSLNHFIKIGSDKFNGIADDAITISHTEESPSGEITFLLTSANETTAWYQSGRNNSYSGHGNSQGVIPNYWGEENFTQNGVVNMSQISSYPFICEFFNQDCIFTSDTRGRGGLLLRGGPLLFSTGDLEVWGQTHLIEGILSRGPADFIMNGNTFDIFNGSLHLRTPRVQAVGFSVGDNVTILSVNFDGDVLTPFVKTTSGGGAAEWTPVLDVSCNDDLCARALGGSGSPIRGMSSSFSSIFLDNLNLTFFITSTMSGSDNFTITTNNNIGSGEVLVFTTSTNIVDIQQSVLLPSSMNNVSSVTLTFNFSGNNQNSDLVFIDNVLVIGNATSDTNANITVFDSDIEFGAGTGDGITYQGDEAIGFSIMNITADLINFIGNSTFVNVIESALNVTTSIELNGTIITDFGDINSNSSNFWDDLDTPSDIPDGIFNSTSWNRSGTDVFLANPDDFVGFGTSDPDKHLEIRHANSIIRLRDTGATASATNAFIEFGGTDAGEWNRTGFIGDSSSSNLDILLRAEKGDLKLGDSTNNNILTLSGGDATFSGNLTVGDVSLGFGDLVSEQNPDAVNALRIKATSSDVDVVLGDPTGYFSIWNSVDDTAVFYVDNLGNTDIAKDLTLADENNIVFRNTNIKIHSHSANELVFESLGAIGDIINQATNNIIFDDGLGNETMRIETDSGNVGIGTSSPSRKLDIVSISQSILLLNNTGSTFGAELDFYGGGGNHWRVKSRGDGDFQIRDITNSVTALYLQNTTGNVGIGTDSPDAKLDVEGITGDGKIVARLSGVTSGEGARLQFTDGVNYNFGIGTFADTTGDFTFNSMNFPGSLGTERMRIKQNGNVGIGTTNPSTIFHTNSSNPVWTQTASGDGQTWNLGQNIGLNYFAIRDGTEGNDIFVIEEASGTGSRNSVYIDSAGLVGIGTNNPSLKLDVENSISAGRIVELRNTNTGSSADVVDMYVGTAAANTNNGFIFFRDGGGIIGEIRGNGVGVDYVTTSDIRQKFNIQNVSNVLSKIMQIQPISYTGEESTNRIVGFSAQEIYSKFPNGPASYDEENDMYMMDYGQMSPYLLQGIKELVNEGQQLKQRIDTLESETCAKDPTWSWCK